MSVAIEVRFPAGRYHASPWDRHVNEADVEWPPSPLRLLRTLIAVWHRKADRGRYPEEVLRSLIHRLAEHAPVYRVPTAVLAHTRHYMPIRSGRSERTTLVFDAFLRLDPTEELLVLWSNTELEDTERELLGHLLERTGYLGRAESWAELQLVETWSRLPNSGPRESADHWGSDDRVELVDLPVAMSAAAYAEWRDDRITELGLEKPRLVREKKLAATLPPDLLDALRLDTGDTRGQGWSQAPGTDTVAYLRPRSWHRPDRGAPQRSPAERTMTTARLALIGRPLPRIEDAIKIGEITRAAAISVADRLPDLDDVPATLSGHDMPEDATHQHAFYLPEDADGDGRIDHVMVHADAGLDRGALTALDRIARLWVSDGVEWRVLLESYGGGPDFRDHPYLGPAKVWQSVTPYLHPWYRKKTFTIEDQIRRELAGRGLPSPELERMRTVTVHGRPRRPVHFHRFRKRSGLTQPDTKGSLWRLTFPEPVAGPIALGFGCHFGLGVFQGAE